MNRDGERWAPRQRRDGQTGGEPVDGPLIPSQVPAEDRVEAWRALETDDFVTALLAAEVLQGSTRDTRRVVAQETIQVDVELGTGERFRIQVQRLP
jgi:hypothetical protein